MSPIENQLSNNDLYVKLLEAFRQMSNEIKGEISSEIKIENAKILEKLDDQNRKIADLNNKYNQLELRCMHLERQYRKNNIIIFGLNVVQESNILEFTLNKFLELLQIKVVESDINNIYVIKTEKGTPIKVEFVSYLKKELILKNANKLKGKKIFIAQDLCHEDRRDNKVLQRHLKLARSKNNFAKIKGNKLTVNEDVYTVEQLVAMDSANEAVRTESNLELNKNYQSNSAPSTPATEQNFGSTFSFPNVSELRESGSSVVNILPSDDPSAKKKKIINNKSGSTSNSGQNTPRVTRNQQGLRLKN